MIWLPVLVVNREFVWLCRAVSGFLLCLLPTHAYFDIAPSVTVIVLPYILPDRAWNG